MDIEEPTESRLIRFWRSGDRVAGDKLLRRYAPVLEQFFSRRVRRNVDDLVQRTLLACTQSVDRFEGRSSFKTYLLGIAQNQFLMSLRSESRSGRELSPLSTRQVETPSQLAAFREEQLIVVLALIKVDPEFRSVLKAFYWGGRSVEEIAGDLGIRPGTVKSRLSRGRAALRENILSMDVPARIRDEALRELVAFAKAPED